MSNGEECLHKIYKFYMVHLIDLGSNFGCYVFILTTNFMWWQWNDYEK